MTFDEYVEQCAEERGRGLTPRETWNAAQRDILEKAQAIVDRGIKESDSQGEADAYWAMDGWLNDQKEVDDGTD